MSPKAPNVYMKAEFIGSATRAAALEVDPNRQTQKGRQIKGKATDAKHTLSRGYNCIFTQMGLSFYGHCPHYNEHVIYAEAAEPSAMGTPDTSCIVSINRTSCGLSPGRIYDNTYVYILLTPRLENGLTLRSTLGI